MNSALQSRFTFALLLLCFCWILCLRAAEPQTSPTPTAIPRPFQQDDLRVHDPSTITKCGDTYRVFSTGPGISSRHSKDLVHWIRGPRVFTNLPAWHAATIPGNRGYLWAPDVVHLTNGYFLYYSISTFGKNTSVIGLAVNNTLDPAAPDYHWDDHGLVVQTISSNNYNATDPSIMHAPDGRLWLAFGSYWSGIKLLELNPATGLRLQTKTPPISLAHSASIEAPALWHHAGSFYLFVNWGTCCRGTNSTYEIRVGRSASITGPYLDRDGKDMLHDGGSLLLSSAGHRVGPGHAGILVDGDREFFSYHFYDAEHAGRPRLEIAGCTGATAGPLSATPCPSSRKNSPKPTTHQAAAGPEMQFVHLRRKYCAAFVGEPQFT